MAGNTQVQLELSPAGAQEANVGHRTWTHPQSSSSRRGAGTDTPLGRGCFWWSYWPRGMWLDNVATKRQTEPSGKVGLAPGGQRVARTELGGDALQAVSPQRLQRPLGTRLVSLCLRVLLCETGRDNTHPQGCEDERSPRVSSAQTAPLGQHPALSSTQQQFSSGEPMAAPD